MSELGDHRYRERLVRYRYLHCRMRLQERYGLEITQDEYQKLSDRFARDGWPGQWRTDTGAVEAWIEYKQALVCAHYRPNEQLITTFQKPPPIEEEYVTPHSGTEESKVDRQAKELNRLLKLNEELHRRSDFKAVATIRELGSKINVLRDQLNQLQQQRVVVNKLDREIGWYKQRVNDAVGLLKTEKVIQGVALLEALVGLPKGFRSQLDPKKATQLVLDVAQYRQEELSQLYEEIPTK